MNSNDLLAAVAAYVVSDGGDQELAKAKVKRILAGVSDSPAKKPDTVDSVIKQILLELGIPNSLKGYSRVIYAIRIVAENPSVADSITKRLYPMVAKEFNDTPPRVERSIRHAVESAFDRCDTRVISRYFGNTVSPKKASPPIRSLSPGWPMWSATGCNEKKPPPVGKTGKRRHKLHRGYFNIPRKESQLC